MRSTTLPPSLPISPFDGDSYRSHSPSPTPSTPRALKRRSASPCASSPLTFLYPSMPMPPSTPASASPKRSSWSDSYSPSGSGASTPTQSKTRREKEKERKHHIHTLTSSHHTPTGGKSKHRAEAADVQRLLDPSYTGVGADGDERRGRRSMEVYVDPNGDLHDPDYRHFPVAERFVPSGARRRHQAGRAALGSPSRHHHHHHQQQQQQHRQQRQRRPYWETTTDNEQALTDEEEEELLAAELGVGLDDSSTSRIGGGVPPFLLAHARYNNMSSSSGVSHLAPSSFSVSHKSTTTTTQYTHGYSPNTFYSPTGTNSTLPTSYESGSTVLTASASELDSHPQPQSSSAQGQASSCPSALGKVKGSFPGLGLSSGIMKKRGSQHRRRLSKGDKEKERMMRALEAERESFRRSVDAARELDVLQKERESEKEMRENRLEVVRDPETEKPEEEEERERREREDEEDREAILGGGRHGHGHGEYVPTCGESLRRQWHAFALSFRFGVFRAQRRVMRRVRSLM